jgi:hypothetical protein
MAAAQATRVKLLINGKALSYSNAILAKFYSVGNSNNKNEPESFSTNTNFFTN